MAAEGNAVFKMAERSSEEIKARLFAEGNIADLQDYFDIIIETEQDHEHER